MNRNAFTEAVTSLISAVPSGLVEPFAAVRRDAYTAEMAKLQMQQKHEERMAVLKIVEKGVEQGKIEVDSRFVLALLLNQEQQNPVQFLLE